MDRTTQALSDLQNTNLRSNQEAIAELNELLRFGNKELEGAFRDTLNEEAHAVEPLHYITKGKYIPRPVSIDPFEIPPAYELLIWIGIAFPDITRENSSKLRTVNLYVTSATRTAGAPPPPTTRVTSIYAEVRGPYVASTLQNLATASVSTIRKTDPNAIYRQGTSGIGTYSVAMEKLFAAEWENICPIFVREQWAPTHTATCNNALQEFARTLSELHTHIKNNLVTDCFLAYEAVDIVSGMSFRLEARNPELKQPVTNALRPIRETAKYSLSRLLEDIRQRVSALQQLPADASSERITYDTMARLTAMTSYLEPLGGILASVGEAGWRAPSANANPNATPALDVGIPGRDLFASYLNDTLDTLLTALDGKARTLLKSKTAQGVFLSNNLAVVDRSLNTTALASILSDAGKAKLDAHRKRALALYLDSWREPSVHLRDVQYTNRSSHQGTRPPSGSISAVDSAAFVKALSNRDRDATKEKFKAFNASFDACVAQHRAFRFEPEVRAAGAREVASLIEPLYARFWDRYHDIDKGKGKYVRYGKGEMGALLAGLG